MSSFDGNGLQTDSVLTIFDNIVASLKQIYANDINVDSNAPDGQLINVFAQEIADLFDRLKQVNASFDLNQAIGNILDQRASSFLGILRQGATFTQQQVSITVDRNLNLPGLDAQATVLNPTGTIYTVADNQGNQFFLLDTTNLIAGTTVLTFRAAKLGSLTTLPNTITNSVTIFQGVTGVNNTTGALEVGLDGELDSSFRIRALRSAGMPSQGYIDGLRAALLNVTGVTEARVYENETDETDVNNIPPHSSWSIVEGGANTDIANTIIIKKSTGSGLKGAVSVLVTLSDGQVKDVKFDRPLSKILYIKFDIQTTKLGQVFDEAEIKNYIETNLTYEIGEAAETSKITNIALAAIDSLGGGGVPLNVQVSKDNAAFVDFLNVDTVNEKWSVVSANINIVILP